MKNGKIFFAGNAGQPCESHYQISLQKPKDLGLPNVLVLIHDCSFSNQSTSLNSEDIASKIVNRILENDLYGIQIRFIRVFCATQLFAKMNPEICVWPITPHFKIPLKHRATNILFQFAKRLSIQKYVRNSHSTFLAFSHDHLAGDTKVYVTFNNIQEANDSEKKMISDIFSNF